LNQEVIIELRMGECFLIMLTSRGEVYSMGENIDSQLGLEGMAYSDTP
jgi:mitogen-activated protein kinase kinase kinase 9